ncbi:MAG: hypothetical protein Fur0022_23740 [Anaerolineales bacterium]
MQKIKFLIFYAPLLLLIACSTPGETTPTEQPPTPLAVEPTIAPPEATLPPTVAPTEPAEAYPPPAPTTNAYPAPTQNPLAYPAPLDTTPVAVSFPSADGTLLTGTYYPPRTGPVPIVVLMHQFGSDQHQWDEIAVWLQTGTPPAGNEWLPQMAPGMTFAVLTFDFRGHGESEGNAGDDAGLLMDAQSAVAFGKTQLGADPLRVITIGTSIGADGAVDACIKLNEGDIAETQEYQGCLGAMALSPGNFLGVNYTRAATAFVGDPHFSALYCLAAENDSSAPLLCNSLSGNRYKAVIYPGNAHGMSLLKAGFDPNVGDVILEFLLESLQLRQ